MHKLYGRRVLSASPPLQRHCIALKHEKAEHLIGFFMAGLVNVFQVGNLNFNALSIFSVMVTSPYSCKNNSP